jgi:hypothetical protein
MLPVHIEIQKFICNYVIFGCLPDPMINLQSVLILVFWFKALLKIVYYALLSFFHTLPEIRREGGA